MMEIKKPMNKGLTLAELLIVAGLFTVLVMLCAIPEFLAGRVRTKGRQGAKRRAQPGDGGRGL